MVVVVSSRGGSLGEQAARRRLGSAATPKPARRKFAAL